MYNDFYNCYFIFVTGGKGVSVDDMETYAADIKIKTAEQNKLLLKRILKNYEAYLFLIPTLIFFTVFSYGPLYGVQIAFRNFNGALGIWGSRWVGLRHFANFFDSYYFWTLIRNTVTLSLYSLAAGFPMPIIFALMLNEVKNIKYKRFVQTVTYAPHFISMVVIVGIITIILSPSSGIVNHVIKSMGFEPIYFIAKPSMFRHIYVWSGIWQNVGWGSIIYLAALASVDMEQHEAAVIDGASRLQRIRHINIPAILPTMVILLILQGGTIMSVGFEKVLLMQNDLNMPTSDVISTYVYRRGLINADFSFATAVGLFNSIINFMFLLIFNYVSRKVNETSLF